MKLTDAKYLMAYLLPLCALIGSWYLSVFTFLTPVVTFIIIPIIEYFTPESKLNLPENEHLSKKSQMFFDVLLYLNLPMVYGLVGYSLWVLSNENLQAYEVVGLIFSIGIILGSNGINVAHELGHRQDTFSQIIAKLLLLPSFYTHFTLEHNYGHHVHVSTPKDPATARYKEPIYNFWLRSVSQQYVNAWKLQLLNAQGFSFFSLKNEMLLNTLLQVLYGSGIFLWLGTELLLYAMAMGMIGILLLESINYIEHYGLLRNQRESGRYVPVKEVHSWNSNHLLGRIMLFELTRHSDHHYRASKKYQLLDYHETSPELPFGYPTCIVLALLPKLWFTIMDKKIPSEMKELNLIYEREKLAL